MQQFLDVIWVLYPPLPPRKTPKGEEQPENQKAEIPHAENKIHLKTQKKKVGFRPMYLKTHKEKVRFKPQTFQNAAKQTNITFITFNIHPPSDAARERSICYGFAKWFFSFSFFFLTVIFSGNNSRGVWSRLWSSGSLAFLLTATLPLLMLQLRWE